MFYLLALLNQQLTIMIGRYVYNESTNLILMNLVQIFFSILSIAAGNVVKLLIFWSKCYYDMLIPNRHVSSNVNVNRFHRYKVHLLLFLLLYCAKSLRVSKESKVTVSHTTLALESSDILLDT